MQRLTRVNEKTGTPLAAILLITLMALAFSLIGNLKVVASISNIFIMLVFLTVNASLLNFRRLHPDAPDPPFRVPLQVGGYPLLTILAFLGVLTLLGFNVANIVG